MKMDGDIRVQTDNRFTKLYNDLKSRTGGDFHEVFFSCACLAFSRKKRKPLGKGGGDRFWSKTITPREWACYYSIILSENNMDFNLVQDDNEVISTIEEYANAGMGILIDEFLKDYLLGKQDEPQLDSTCAKELPKNLLHFLFDQTAIHDGNIT